MRNEFDSSGQWAKNSLLRFDFSHSSCEEDGLPFLFAVFSETFGFEKKEPSVVCFFSAMMFGF